MILLFNCGHKRKLLSKTHNTHTRLTFMYICVCVRVRVGVCCVGVLNDCGSALIASCHRLSKTKKLHWPFFFTLRSQTVTFCSLQNLVAVFFAADFNYVTCALQFIIANSSQLKLFKLLTHTQTQTLTLTITLTITFTFTLTNSLLLKVTHAAARSHLIWKSQNVS